MAQEIELSLNIDTKIGVKNVKEFKGTLKDLEKQLKRFKTTSAAKQFKNIDKAIDQTTRKLKALDRLLQGKKLNLTFPSSQDATDASGGRLPSAAGAGAPTAKITGGAGAGSFENNAIKLSKVSRILFRTLNRVNVNFRNLQKSLESIVSALDGIVQSLSPVRAGAGGGPGGTSGGRRGGGGGGGGNVLGRAAGATGFTALDVGNQIQQLFSNRRVRGEFQQSASQLFGEFGSIFGSLVGEIAGDIGKSFGALAEIAFNAFTLPFRRAGLILGGVIKGVGFTIASGLIGGAFSGIGKAFSVGGLLGGIIIGGVTTIVNVAVSVITDAVNEFIDFVKGVVEAAMGIISGLVKVFAGIFKGVLSGIGKIWTSAWKGFLTTAKAVLSETGTLLKEVTKGIVEFGKKGAKAFGDLESMAARAAKEILSVVGDQTQRIIREVSNISIETGFSVDDLGLSSFEVASSGLVKGLGNLQVMFDIMRESAKLAKREFTTVGVATNALLNSFLSYEKTGITVAEVSDKLAALTSIFRTNLGALGPQLGKITGQASSMGIAFDDVLSVVGAMTRTFGSGQEAIIATSTIALLEGLVSPTDKARAALEGLGATFTKVGTGINETTKASFSEVTNFADVLRALASGITDANIREIFPLKQARRGFRGLRDFAKDFEEIQNQSDKTVKSLVRVDTIIANLFKDRLTKVKSSFNGIVRSVGRLSAGLAITTFMTKGLVKSYQELAKLFSSDLGVDAIKSIFDFLKPLLLVINGTLKDIVDTAGAFIQALLQGKGINFDNFIRVRDFFISIVEKTREWVGEFFTVKNIFMVINTLAEKFSNFLEAIPEFIDALKGGGAIGGLEFLLGEDPIRALDSFLTTANDKIASMLDDKPGGGLLEGALGEAPTSLIGRLFAVLIPQAAKFINTIVSFIEDKIGPAIGGIFEDLNLQPLTDALINAAKSAANTFIDVLKEDIAPVLEGALKGFISRILVSEDPAIKSITDTLLAKVDTALTGLDIAKGDVTRNFRAKLLSSVMGLTPEEAQSKALDQENFVKNLPGGLGLTFRTLMGTMNAAPRVLRDMGLPGLGLGEAGPDARELLTDFSTQASGANIRESFEVGTTGADLIVNAIEGLGEKLGRPGEVSFTDTAGVSTQDNFNTNGNSFDLEQ